MKREINNEVHLEQTVTPVESIGKSSAIDKSASGFDSANGKVKKIKKTYKSRHMQSALCVIHTRNARFDFPKNNSKNINK